MTEKTIEQKVAEAILQKNIASIDIGGKVYPIAPPSLATLILVSEMVSTLPVVEKPEQADATTIVASVLHHAKDFSALGDIAAALILGAKRIRDEREPSRWSRTMHTFGIRRKASTAERLAREILDNVRPSVLWDIVVRRLNMHEIGDFFAITTSLSEANLLKPTREVDN